jgi:hypothetical protein
MAEYAYRPEILDELLRYGARPTSATRPELVHEFVSDLYRHELRRLRDRLLAKEFPKNEYFGRVVEMRRRYRIISMRPAEWLEPRSG